jgi:hypothetical protein
MKVLTLFDEKGKIHALFHPSKHRDAPQFRFHPATGHRAEVLDVPAELQHLKPAQLHSSVRVDLDKRGPRLVALNK